MKSLDSILPDLRRPFPGERVDWKVQSVSKKGDSALVVAYVDARDISERLNTVCPDQWSTKFTTIYGPNNDVLGVECALTIRTDEVALTRADVGIGDLDDDRMNAGLKTHYSDALKRAGVHFGINSCAYELPTIWINKEEYLYKTDKIRGLSDKGKEHLAERYNTWVNKDAVKKRFGEAYSG
jgi:hypothetical protein